MVGRELDAYFPPASPRALGEVRLSLRGAGNRKLRDIDLELRAGEIVGIAGLQGSGRTELARALFGVRAVHHGRDRRRRRARRSRPATASAMGIGLSPRTARPKGSRSRQSVRDNALLVARAGSAPGNRDGRRDGCSGRAYASSPPRAATQEVRYLSGGNQQKVVLAKWLAMAPRVLLFDEPTRGIDVGAKAGIHDLMRELARDGAAILMISSELPELHRHERPHPRHARRPHRRRVAGRGHRGGHHATWRAGDGGAE